MSWTPYNGDPALQIGENTPPHIGDDGVFADGAKSERFWSRRPGMNTGQRMQTSMAPGVGVQRFTPDQVFFRDSIARGRWGNALPLAPGDTANRNLNMMRRYPDGTCDMISLEAAGKFYLDLGGRGARDMRSGKP